MEKHRRRKSTEKTKRWMEGRKGDDDTTAVYGETSGFTHNQHRTQRVTPGNDGFIANQTIGVRPAAGNGNRNAVHKRKKAV